MNVYHRKAILGFSFLAETSISLILLLTSSILTLAAPPGGVRSHEKTHLAKGPVAWPMRKSQPLHQPRNAPKLVTFAPVSHHKNPITGTWTASNIGAMAGLVPNVAGACPS